MKPEIRYFIFLLFFLFSSKSFAAGGLPALNLEMFGQNPGCTGLADGKVAVVAFGGIEPYAYVWNTGDTTTMVSGLGAGTYTVTVTDAMQKVVTGTVVLEETVLVWEAVSSEETCENSCDGSALLTSVSGGVPPYVITWSDSAASTGFAAENLCAGLYFATIADQNGCTEIASIDVTLSPEGLWIMSSSTDVTCFGFQNGTAYVGVMTGVPPYSYAWSDPSIPSTYTPDSLEPGKYYVTVTDVNGCTNLDSIVVAEPAPLEVELVVSDFPCRSGGSGAITTQVSGGTPPYVYTWLPSGSGPNPSGLNTGSYFVTVTDAQDCQVSEIGVITGANPDAGTLLPPSDSVCLKNNTAELEASPAGDALIPPGYASIFLLVETPVMLVRQVSQEPIFQVANTGHYTIHTLIYDPVEFNPSEIIWNETTLVEVFSWFFDGGGDLCGDLDTAGVLRIVAECAECINIGDLVWFDFNQDGLQNPGIPGVKGIVVLLTIAGDDGIFGTADDEVVAEEVTGPNGKYLFKCVDPGEYVIVFSPQSLPDDYLFTLPGQGSNPNLDSNADTVTGATAPFIVASGQTDNLSIDAGLRVQCIELQDGGEIGYNQVVCENIYPDKLVNVQSAGIGIAPVEYQWASYVQSGPPPWNIVWQLIPNANSEDYQPPQITQNTFYTRFARYKGCLEYTAVSNNVLVEVIIFNPDSCQSNFVNLNAQAFPEKGMIQLDWSIPNWFPGFMFEVEKEDKEGQFALLKKVGPSQEQMDFFFRDEQPRLGVNRYKVLLRDSFGILETSRLMEVSYAGLPIQIFPNPVRDVLYLDSRRHIEVPVQILLYNVYGQPVHSAWHAGGERLQVEIDMSGIGEGIYFLELAPKGQPREVHKLIKVE